MHIANDSEIIQNLKIQISKNEKYDKIFEEQMEQKNIIQKILSENNVQLSTNTHV